MTDRTGSPPRWNRSADMSALTPEMERILLAISEERMTVNPAGRYVIHGEPRPDRKSRETLRKRGLIASRYVMGRGSYWHLTKKGRDALAATRPDPDLGGDHTTQPNGKTANRRGATMAKPTRASQLGVTDENYAAMLAAQGGGCAICGNPPKTRRLHVDHDHRSGRVRGLLCHRCNRTLANWISPAWLDSARAYLLSSGVMPLGNATRRTGEDAQATREKDE